MFRSATTKIAHNSTVPALARISKDLKALQDLINTEKSVLQNLQKLAQEFAKASEALKQWGIGEGDDLGDTLTACHAVLLHFAAALSRFSNHQTSVRELMKAVRTREENLDELKRRRKSLQSNAESADKKLSKMSSDNKNFQAQADALNKLRDEIRSMDTEIMTEEASLGDFKRSSAKNWLGVKFGALMECCEKGYIVGEMGKLIIAEIPLAPSQPGLPRPYYTGHARTEYLVSEAQRSILEVVYSLDPQQIPAGGMHAPPGADLSAMQFSNTGSSQVGSVAPSSLGYATPDASVRNSRRFSSSVLSSASGFVGLPEVSESTMGGLGLSPYTGPDQMPAQTRSPPPLGNVNGSAISLAQSNPFASPPPQHPHLSNNDINEFGMYPSAGGAFSPRSSSLRNIGEQSQPRSPMIMGGPRGSRFATFPVNPMGPRAQPSSIPHIQSPLIDTRVPSLDIEAPNDSFSSSVAEALGEDWVAGDPPRAVPTNSKAMEAARSPSDYTSPPPQYTATPEPPMGSVSQYGTDDGFASTPVHTAVTPSVATPTVPEEDEEEDGLAYMSPIRDDQASVSSGSHPEDDRRVKFEGVPDHNTPTEPDMLSQSLGRETAGHEQRQAYEHQEREVSPAQLTNQSSLEAGIQPNSPNLEEEPPSQLSTTSAQPSLPDPPRAPLGQEDEKALNAAAAREVSREMDALMFSPPGTYPGSAAPPPSTSLQPATPSFSQGLSATRPDSFRGAAPSPALTPRNDSSYVRARDRSPSIPPRSPMSDGARSPALQHSPEGVATPTSSVEGRFGPPPTLSLPPVRSTSPLSGSTPYRTPLELPTAQPAGPGSFYNLPTLSGSGTLPSSGRTVAAGLFRRQMRSATSPPPDTSRSPTSEVGPLNVKKRSTPSSPYLQPQTNDNLMPRVPSAPIPETSDPRTEYGGQPRSVSASSPRPVDSSAVQPPSMERASMHSENGDEDPYDYLSAYVDEHSAGDDRRMSRAGYGQGRFATNLDR